MAEVETYIEHVVPPATWEAYRSLFATLGVLHQVWADAWITRPAVSTFGPPGTLRRQLSRLRSRDVNPRTQQQLTRVASLVHRLKKAWVPAHELPCTVVHGDARLENVPADPHGRPVVLDLGFTARRPRVHDLAYAMAWILLGPDDSGLATPVDLPDARSCVQAYVRSAGQALTPLEGRAFDGYLAGACLYLTTVAAFVPDPDATVLEAGNMGMIDIAEHVLRNPGQLV